MYRVLILSILVTGAIFLGLTLTVVLNKAWRERRRGRIRSHRLALEPAVLEYAHGEHVSILPALGGQLRRADRAALEELLLDNLQRVRGIERERLGRAFDELGYVDEYLRALRHPNWWRRAEAAEKLGIAGVERAAEPLAQALDDDAYEVRLRAAKSLGALGGITAVQPLIAALREPNRWSTIRVADILSTVGSSVSEEIFSVFPDLNRTGRLAAIDILGSRSAMEAAGWLRERMRDDDPDVRVRACCALGAIDGPGAGPALERALEDGHWAVRSMAARSLGRIRHEPSVPALCRAMHDRTWWVRANAAAALRDLGAPGLEALERMLDDYDGFARDQAVQRLEEAGVLDDAVDGIASAEAERREASRKLLVRFVRVGQHSRLRDHAERHPDPRVRRTLTAFLKPGTRPETVTP